MRGDGLSEMVTAGRNELAGKRRGEVVAGGIARTYTY
jgi:hypothetical protein